MFSLVKTLQRDLAWQMFVVILFLMLKTTKSKFSLASFSSIQAASWLARLAFFDLLKKQRSNHQQLVLEKRKSKNFWPFQQNFCGLLSYFLRVGRGFFIDLGRFDTNWTKFSFAGAFPPLSWCTYCSHLSRWFTLPS